MFLSLVYINETSSLAIFNEIKKKKSKPILYRNHSHRVSVKKGRSLPLSGKFNRKMLKLFEIVFSVAFLRQHNIDHVKRFTCQTSLIDLTTTMKRLQYIPLKHSTA